MTDALRQQNIAHTGPDHWHAAAPQSWHEVKPFEDQLRQLDDRLRIVWNPRAIVTKPGTFDVTGASVPPEYAGRWEVIIPDDPFRTQTFRTWTVVCRVTQPIEVREGADTLPAMADRGPYAPIGQWLVDFLRAADRHNRDELLRLREKMERMNAHQDAAAESAGHDAAREVLAREWHEGTKEGGGVSEFHPVAADLRGGASRLITQD
jgi:hypothetical protein